MNDDGTEEIPHMIQYAMVDYLIIYHTEDMTDAQIRERLGDWASKDQRIERYDRCINCEAWTRTGGKLRENIDCPAVKAALEKRDLLMTPEESPAILDTSQPPPTDPRYYPCGHRDYFGDPKCPTCFFEGLEASGLYRCPPVDLAPYGLGTLRDWYGRLISQEWPGDFPLPMPSGFYPEPDGDPPWTRPDSAWYAWDRATRAINARICEIEDQAEPRIATIYQSNREDCG